MTRLIRTNPDIPKLRAQGYVCVDLHFHSTSSDGSATIKDIVARAEELGIGFALTDHNVVRSALEAGHTKDVLVIPGIELTTCDKIDFLIYFYSFKDLEDYYIQLVRANKAPNLGFNLNKTCLPTLQALREAKKKNAVIVLPHPFTLPPKNSAAYAAQHPEIIDYVDCIEAINGVQSKARNLKAESWANMLGKALSGGSDGHTLSPLGTTVVAIKCKKTIQSYLDNLRKGNAVVVGKELTFLHATRSRLSLVKNNIRLRTRQNAK